MRPTFASPQSEAEARILHLGSVNQTITRRWLESTALKTLVSRVGIDFRFQNLNLPWLMVTVDLRYIVLEFV